MNAIQYIRKDVFRLNQTDFAREINVAQSTVSRWESGAVPDLKGMAAIRDAAIKRGIDWRDDWFFSTPTSQEVAQ
jgi:transcriptional regulator with XRE-family HTH domain